MFFCQDLWPIHFLYASVVLSARQRKIMQSSSRSALKFMKSHLCEGISCKTRIGPFPLGGDIINSI